MAWPRCLTACHAELKITEVIYMVLSGMPFLFDSMTVSCSTNLLLCVLATGRKTPCTCRAIGGLSLFAQPAHRYLTMLRGGWRVKGKVSVKHMPFQHRILSTTARLGVVMVAGMVRPGPPRSMAWWVVIGWFYCWWLLAAVRRESEAGEKAMGPSMRYGSGARPPQSVGKHVSPRLSRLTPFLFLCPLLPSSSTLPA